MLWNCKTLLNPFFFLTAYLFPVLLIFNGIHSTAWFSIKHEVKSGIFAETAGIAQEGVFFIIVDGPVERQPQSLHTINFNVSCYLYRTAEETYSSPALVALIHILTAVATHPWIGGHRGTAAGTLQGLSGGLVVLIKI